MKLYIIIIVLFTISYKTSGTEYLKITSLEGKEMNILLESDNANNLLSIRLDSGDQMCVSGFIGLVLPIQIHKNFLIIRIKIRGGSGVSLQYLVIICVSKDKIYKSLNVISLIRDVDHLGNIDVECEITSIQIIQKNGEFILWVKEKSHGKQRRTINHALCFDCNLKIFYSKQLLLSGLFNIDNDTGDVFKKVLFEKDNIFPIVEFVSKYYFIDGFWYIRDNESHLTLFSNHCSS